MQGKKGSIDGKEQIKSRILILLQSRAKLDVHSRGAQANHIAARLGYSRQYLSVVMKEMVEERSNGLTKDNKAAILARIIKRYKEEPTMTKSQIAGKILSFKTEYRKPVTGNQD